MIEDIENSLFEEDLEFLEAISDLPEDKKNIILAYLKDKSDEHKMKLYANRKDYEWAKIMQDEGRTRRIEFLTFRTEKNKGTEIEVEVKEVKR